MTELMGLRGCLEFIFEDVANHPEVKEHTFQAYDVEQARAMLRSMAAEKGFELRPGSVVVAPNGCLVKVEQRPDYEAILALEREPESAPTPKTRF